MPLTGAPNASQQRDYNSKEKRKHPEGDAAAAWLERSVCCIRSNNLKQPAKSEQMKVPDSYYIYSFLSTRREQPAHNSRHLILNKGPAFGHNGLSWGLLHSVI